MNNEHRIQNLEIRKAQLTNAISSIIEIVANNPAIEESIQRAIVGCADGAVCAKEIAEEFGMTFNN